MEKHHALRYGANSYPPGQECHGSTPRCVVWPTSDGASLPARRLRPPTADRKSTRLNSSHGYISYAVFCLKKKKKRTTTNHHASSRALSETVRLRTSHH